MQLCVHHDPNDLAIAIAFFMAMSDYKIQL